MSDREIAQKAPYDLELEAGKNYAWCRCACSQAQPLCDGAHSVTDLRPLVFTAEETGTKWMCGCKHTKDEPFCDGSHSQL